MLVLILIILQLLQDLGPSLPGAFSPQSHSGQWPGPQHLLPGGGPAQPADGGGGEQDGGVCTSGDSGQLCPHGWHQSWGAAGGGGWACLGENGSACSGEGVTHGGVVLQVKYEQKDRAVKMVLEDSTLEEATWALSQVTGLCHLSLRPRQDGTSPSLLTKTLLPV